MSKKGFATKEEMIEYLDEIKNSYNFDNRARTENSNGFSKSCFYFKEDANGQGCAVGRRIKDKKLCKRLDSKFHNKSVASWQVWDILPKYITRFGIGFLCDIQSFHDTNDNWVENGLSDAGKERYTFIKESIENGYYNYTF